MTLGGWCVMILSIGSVLSMLGFCLYRILTLPAVEDVRLDKAGNPVDPSKNT